MSYVYLLTLHQAYARHTMQSPLMFCMHLRSCLWLVQSMRYMHGLGTFPGETPGKGTKTVYLNH